MGLLIQLSPLESLAFCAAAFQALGRLPDPVPPYPRIVESTQPANPNPHRSPRKHGRTKPGSRESARSSDSIEISDEALFLNEAKKFLGDQTFDDLSIFLSQRDLIEIGRTRVINSKRLEDLVIQKLQGNRQERQEILEESSSQERPEELALNSAQWKELSEAVARLVEQRLLAEPSDELRFLLPPPPVAPQ